MLSEQRKKEIRLEINREKAAAIDAEINRDTADINEGLQGSSARSTASCAGPKPLVMTNSL
jgi:hypothetical protein